MIAQRLTTVVSRTKSDGAASWTSRTVAKKKGQKRSLALIAKTTKALLTYIEAHGGQRIEQIAAGMKTSSKDLMLPSKKLLAEKKIKTKGEKRGTRYFPA